jgi:hypothetical protein
VGAQQRFVTLAPEDQATRRGHVGQRLVVVGIDEQQRCLAVLDDVGDLVAGQAEVDRDDDAARRRCP